MAKMLGQVRRGTVLAALACLWCSGAQVRGRESLEAARKRAEKGDANAQAALGTMYRDGQGATQDLGEAVRWFRRAAAQGNAEAENSLGFLYDYGGGVPIDHREAAGWYPEGCRAGQC
jgi:hypothetical protein